MVTVYNQGMNQYALVPEFVDVPEDVPVRRHPDYRRTWEQHFKVTIPAGYHIHHKDKDIFNSDPSNLLCLPKDEHIKLHEMKGDKKAVLMLTRGRYDGI
jgi:hypothetical protein